MSQVETNNWPIFNETKFSLIKGLCARIRHIVSLSWMELELEGWTASIVVIAAELTGRWIHSWFKGRMRSSAPKGFLRNLFNRGFDMRSLTIEFKLFLRVLVIHIMKLPLVIFGQIHDLAIIFILQF